MVSTPVVLCIVFIHGIGCCSNVCRNTDHSAPGVVALDGLLYVIGGESDKSFVHTIEVYNPNTNTWSMETFSKNDNDVFDFQVYIGVVVHRPPYLITN